MLTRQLPDDPQEWINRALSNLAIAQTVRSDVYYEDLCFNAQQAAEKALKSMLLYLNGSFPYTHDLAVLVTMLHRSGAEVPPHVEASARLTQYAVAARYPGVGPATTAEEYESAVRIAEQVVRWVEEQIATSPR